MTAATGPIMGVECCRAAPEGTVGRHAIPKTSCCLVANSYACSGRKLQGACNRRPQNRGMTRTTHYHEMKSIVIHNAKYSVEKHRNKHSERWRDKTCPAHTQLVMSCKASVPVLGSVVLLLLLSSLLLLSLLLLLLLLLFTSRACRSTDRHYQTTCRPKRSRSSRKSSMRVMKSSSAAKLPAMKDTKLATWVSPGEGNCCRYFSAAL